MKPIILVFVTIILFVGIPSIVVIRACEDALGAWIGLWLVGMLLFFGGALILWDKELRDGLKTLWKSR